MSHRHNFKLDPDQADTGKYGVRKYCSTCKAQQTTFNPLLHKLLKKRRAALTKERSE